MDATSKQLVYTLDESEFYRFYSLLSSHSGALLAGWLKTSCSKLLDKESIEAILYTLLPSGVMCKFFQTLVTISRDQDDASFPGCAPLAFLRKLFVSFSLMECGESIRLKIASPFRSLIE